MSRPSRNVLTRWSAAALVCGFMGCNPSATEFDSTVQGTVTIDDQLAPGGTVVFYPVSDGPSAVGSIAKDGSYSLRIGRGDPSDPDYSRIPSGEYVATVAVLGPSSREAAIAEGGPPAAGPRLVAEKYSDKSKSDLKYTVKEGANVIVLKLDGPWADPPPEESAEETSDAPGEDASSADEQAGANEQSPAEADQGSNQDSEKDPSAEAPPEEPNVPGESPAPSDAQPPAVEQQSPAKEPAE